VGVEASGATIERMTSRRAGLALLIGLPAAFLVGCTASPSAGTPAALTSGCLTQSQATAVWTTVNHRLDAIELDPNHAGVAAVTTGNALTTITTYLQQTLVAHKLTEREVDRLDQLTVVQGGCNGGRLILNVTETLVQDDYLKASGGVDHHDASVGKQLNLLQEYVQSDGAWKETDFSDLTAPGATPTPRLVRFSRSPCYTLLRSI
jgi:hypothetical protein